MQANIRIAGNILNSLPEVHLRTVGSSKLFGINVIFIHTQTAENRIGIDSLLFHRLINQAQHHSRVTKFLHKIPFSYLLTSTLAGRTVAGARQVNA